MVTKGHKEDCTCESCKLLGRIFGGNKPMKHPEYDLQKAVCEYLKLKCPSVIFLSDTIASVKLTKPQQGRNKAIQKPGFKCPDLIILNPRNGYCGLFIELKVSSPHKRNGELKSDPHIKGQAETMKELRRLGYLASFATGFYEAKEIIDSYFGITA